MLQSRPADLPYGSDALLVLVCKLFQDRLAAYVAAVDHPTFSEPNRAEGDRPERRRMAELRAEWQALGRGIASAPAFQSVGLRAKADALHAYLQHIGGTEGVEIDLARSLISDLRRD